MEMDWQVEMLQNYLFENWTRIKSLLKFLDKGHFLRRINCEREKKKKLSKRLAYWIFGCNVLKRIHIFGWKRMMKLCLLPYGLFRPFAWNICMEQCDATQWNGNVQEKRIASIAGVPNRLSIKGLKYSNKFWDELHFARRWLSLWRSCYYRVSMLTNLLGK